MNLAQVDFLDFERPRCWILALSWNELSSVRLFRILNVHVVESCPYFEMNSAQVDFLDFERPRCWILALSWNELSSGSLKGSLPISGLSLFSETRRPCLWTSGQKWWMHSLGRELKKAFIFIHRPYLRIVWICFIYLRNRHRPGRERESCRPGPTPVILSKIALKLYVVPVHVDAVRSLLSTIVKKPTPNLRHLFQLSRLV